MKHCGICGDRPSLHNRLCVMRGAEPLDTESEVNDDE